MKNEDLDADTLEEVERLHVEIHHITKAIEVQRKRVNEAIVKETQYSWIECMCCCYKKNNLYWNEREQLNFLEAKLITMETLLFHHIYPNRNNNNNVVLGDIFSPLE